MLRIYRFQLLHKGLKGIINRKCSNSSALHYGDNDDDDDLTPYCTEPETNFVKLIGTTIGDSSNLKDGDQTCTLIQRFVNTSTHHTIAHKLTLQKNLLENAGIKRIMKGQRLNINGYLRSIPFECADHLMRNAIAIIPDELTFCPKDEEPKKDLCIVMMTARVVSPFSSFNKRMWFTLQTHVQQRDSKGNITGNVVPHTHWVEVVDKKVQDYVMKNVKQNDLIYVEGHLNYNKYQLMNGRNRMAGNIVAIHIEKSDQP